MRYLGNKDSIIGSIISILKRNNLLDSTYTFFDACCGTGSVSSAVKKYYNIILNDNLLMATTFAKGRIVKSRCDFKKLQVDPFLYLNNNLETRNGFFYQNYAPTISGRMYFSDFNAGRIDYFRETIENWYVEGKINEDEYSYLLSSLLESVSKVANVAGVYGSYLKTWDPRAKKDIFFVDVDWTDTTNFEHKICTYNSNIEDLIQSVDCDILYLDPPYTRNSYSVQYHILETLVRNDNPKLKGITGARSYTSVSNVWSKPYEVEVCFDRIIAKTKANYILFSYSSDGILSKDFILSIFRRYCILDTIQVEEIPYKQYHNHQTYSSEGHCEYLFFAQKKRAEDVNYYCPLNYMGGKNNVIEQFKPYITGRNKFVDLMGGGFNVGINANINSVIYNDINFFVVELIKMFRETDTPILLKFIDAIIKKYGLKKGEKEAYLQLRNDYNLKYRCCEKSIWYLYVLILYGFQQQIRFNSSYEFNNPVGESGYNDCIKEKIVSFSRRIKELNVSFNKGDYEGILDQIDGDCIVYVDPPYLITQGSYNDGKRGFRGWNEDEEVRLLKFVDNLISLGCKVLISNILQYKNQTNNFLANWLKSKSEVVVVPILVRKRKEVLIVIK